MKKPLRVLIVGDSENDAQIIIREMKKGGFEPEHEQVKTAKSMRKALREKPWDLVLSNYKLPKFSGIKAIALLKEARIDIPIIVLSGTIGEAETMKCVRLGAHDCIDKRDLSRLCFSIKRELAEAELRIKLRWTEEAWHQNATTYRLIVEKAKEAIIITQDVKLVFANHAAAEMTGYSKQILTSRTFTDFIHPEDRNMVVNHHIGRLTGKDVPSTYSFRVICNDGTVKWAALNAAIIPWEGKPATLNFLNDITERKRAEEALQRSEEKYRQVSETAYDLIMTADLNSRITYVNKAVRELAGSIDPVGMNLLDFTPPKLRQKQQEMMSTRREGKSEVLSFEWELVNPAGENVIVDVRSQLLKENNTPTGVLFIGRDITEHKKIEEDLRKSEERYRTILEDIHEGYFEVDLAGNYIFLNDAIINFFGYTKEELIGKNYRQYQDEANSKKTYRAFNEIYKKKESARATLVDAEYFKKDGTTGTFELSAALVRDAQGKPTGFRGTFRDVTARKQIEETLRRSEERYRTILEDIREGYYEIDLTGRYTFLNDAIIKNFGYTKEELIGFDQRKFTDEANAKKLYKIFNQIYKTGEPVKGLIEAEYSRKDGTKGTYELSASLLRDAQGKPIGFRGVARDTTERKRAEEALRKSEERYRTILEDMEEGYFEVDPAGTFTFANDALCISLGYTRDELIGMNYWQYADDESAKKLFQAFNQVYKTGEPLRDLEHKAIRKDGKGALAEISISLMRDSEGKPAGFRGVSRDITERKRIEERIKYLATHDALTGLPNRTMFSQLLKHAIESAHRHERQFAVLFIDLDRFKNINDTLGHEAGDQLLQEVATRFKQALRASDIIARLGGDEFVLLIEEISDPSQIVLVARKILSATIKPMVLMNQECRVTSSIGISIFPSDAENEQSLMKNADIAMYFAKEEGKNNYQFYSKNIKSQASGWLALETNLGLALERNELSLNYQAKLDLKTNTISGAEALLRWQNPQLGPVSPVHFIPVAEETGLIVPIGTWALRTACAQNVRWIHDGLQMVCIAVNLSLRQLTDDNLIADIEKALGDSGMAPDLLELEITESMVMHNPERTIALLSKIKQMGVRLAIDDFGTGYSSLAQLRRFPIDTLKVDRSFIRNIPKDFEDNEITKAIIGVGKTLSLRVVAEGVETEEQMAFLREHACDEMQGYYFSKPIAADQFAELLRSHRLQTEK